VSIVLPPKASWTGKEPYLSCALSNPRAGFGDAKQIEVAGLIDTGASVVCIPRYIALDLGLVQVDLITIQTAGSVHQGAIYDCRILIPDLNFVDEIRVCAIKGANMNAGPNSDPSVTILLGRSLLRRFQLHFDGPANEFSLSLG
jgi:predicted aspartyl protease